MGQYYATAVAPAEGTTDSTKTGEHSDSDTTMISPTDDGEKTTEADMLHEYDHVNSEDMRSDDIVDYKSEQFSKSPRSSPNSTVNSSWRTSQASTNTAESSSPAADSDDTLGKDMSELSSINSRLSTLNDSRDPCFGTLDRKAVHSKNAELPKSHESNLLPTVIEKVPLVANSGSQSNFLTTPSMSLPATRKPVSTIEDALEDLENIEKTAQSILMKHESIESYNRAGSVTPTNNQNVEQLNTAEPPISSFASQNIEHEDISVTSTSLESSNQTPNVVPLESDKIKERGETASNHIEANEASDLRVEKVSIASEETAFKLSNEATASQTPTASMIPEVEPEDVEMNNHKMSASLTVEIVGENRKRPSPPPRKKHNARGKEKKEQADSFSEEKPPLPPSASPVPKTDVKKRWWSRTKETPIFISRESYNEEQVSKELQRLRQSYKESDINDFLDSLDNTKIPMDYDDEFFEQLLTGIKNDLDPIAPTESTESLNIISEAPLPENTSCENISDLERKVRPRSLSTSKRFEKVKERIKELLRRRKKKYGKCVEDQLVPSSSQTSATNSRPETPSSRPATPRSRSTTPECRVFSSDTTKIEDTNKKSFGIFEFLKKSSPKVLRKHYDKKMRRKSDSLQTSENEADDKEAFIISTEDIHSTRSEASGSRSNLKGSKTSLDESKSIKKEVRFTADESAVVKHFDDKPPEHSIIDTTPTFVDIKVTKQQIITVEETIEFDQQLAGQDEGSLNEDASYGFHDSNDRNSELTFSVENLLPKLPERVKPPRRKKKQKVIPSTIENIANEDFRVSIGSDQSRESWATNSTTNITSENPSIPAEDSPTPNQNAGVSFDFAADYSAKENSSEAVQFLNREESSLSRTEDRNEYSFIGKDVPHMHEAEPHGKAETHVSSSCEDKKEISNRTISTKITDTSTKNKYIDQDTCTVNDSVKIDVQASNKALILDETSINAYSSAIEANSLKEPSPQPFPNICENVSSFYDNDNIFEEPMSRIVEEDASSISEEEIKPIPLLSITSSKPGSVSLTSISQAQKSEEKCETISVPSDTAKLEVKNKNVSEPSHELYDEAAEVCDAMKQFTSQNEDPKDVNCKPLEIVTKATPQAAKLQQNYVGSEITSQEEFVYDSEGKVVNKNKYDDIDINVLSSITQEMTLIASDMDLEIQMAENIMNENPKAPIENRDVSPSTLHVHDSSTPDIISRIQVNHCQRISDTDFSEILKPICFQTDNKNEHLRCEPEKEKDGWVFVEKDGAHDFPKSSITSSKGFYGPPIIYSSGKVLAPNKLELESKDGWIQTSENPVPVPPRQFQQKMPMQVVTELKSILSENTTAPILRKAPEPLPRWDSNIKFNAMAKKLPAPTSTHQEPARYMSSSALQQLGLNETSLLGEIENILGVGPLASSASAPKPRISPPKGFTFTELNNPLQPANFKEPSPAVEYNSSTASKSKWIRTESGGYVRVPSQENLLIDDKNVVELKQQEPTSSPNVSNDTTVPSKSTANSSKQTVSPVTTVPKFTPTSRDFGQPNQFTAQINSQTKASSNQRSVSLTRLGDKSEKDNALSSQDGKLEQQKLEQNGNIEKRALQKELAPPPRALGSNESVVGGGGDGLRGRISGQSGYPYNRTPEAFAATKAGSASPSLGRKEYRRVAYDGSTLHRRPSQENVAAPRPEESFAWRDKEAQQLKTSLPRSQNPTVTLLQKKRGDQLLAGEGHIPSKRPEYLSGDESSYYKPSDKLYTIKREYESEDDDTGSSRRFAVLGPRKIDGVGPTTVDGVPVSLKTGVKSEYQGDWYRKMFDSLHKVKDDDFVTVKYKVPRVRYGSSGYMSEPEGYDSDFGLSSRYSTLDRRGRGGLDWDPNDTLSRNVKRYVHQPGRIEDYIPGRSSLSEKELRANPEVEYKLESRDQDPPRGSSNHRYNPARMQMSHALKEGGYESDSTLVFRKQSERRPENRNISEVYRQIQRGGEVPLEGLRKAAPRKPKDDFFVVYSDLDLGLSHPALSDLSAATRAFSSPALSAVQSTSEVSNAPSSDNPKSTTESSSEERSSQNCSSFSVGDEAEDMSSKPKVSTNAKISPASPNAPRRVSSKWHPSLIKITKDKPPAANIRSVSAERVRATRALYSSWHREMVTKSKDKLSPGRATLHAPRTRASPSSTTPKTFLLGRRAVSESRFTIQDRELSPSPGSNDNTSALDKTRKLTSVNRSNSINVKSIEPKIREKSCLLTSASPPRRLLSPRSDSPRRNSSPVSELGRPPLSRHTVSSKIKTKSYQEKSGSSTLGMRSRSAEHPGSARIARHSCCIASTEKDSHSKTLPGTNKTKILNRRAHPTDSKRLRQSESFDTTHSNETGYSSMLDLSPSPSPDNLHFASPIGRSSKNAKTFERRNQSTSVNFPSSYFRRTLTSADYAERRAKWETLSRSEPKKRFRSISPPKSLIPLRSTSLVRQASSAMKKNQSKLTEEQPRRSRSLEVVSSSPYISPEKYRQYILEVRLAAPQNVRVSNLRRLFSSLDRVQHLERSISSTDLSLLERKASYLLGFEAWKKLKDNERKALEYKLLINELDVAQSNKDFLYCVSPERKWIGDSFLRGKNKSVQEIRRKFLEQNTSPERFEQRSKTDFIYSSGVYKGLWRGESVKECARNIISKQHPSELKTKLNRDSIERRSMGLWTSLSLEQVNALKDQLNDIYGSMHNVQSWKERKKLSRSRSQKERGETNRETHETVNIAATGRLLTEKFAKRAARPASADCSLLTSPELVPSSLSKLTNIEAERKKLSKQLSLELKEKVNEQRKGADTNINRVLANHGSRRTPSISPDSTSRMSPRTCYSLDISDSSQPSSLTSHADDQFFLLLQKPLRSRSLPPDLNDEDGESSDSDVSVRTVIHKDVAGKVKFFEKRARKQSRSSERYSSVNNRLSLPSEPDLCRFSATLPASYKKRQSAPTLSSHDLYTREDVPSSKPRGRHENYFMKRRVGSESMSTSKDHRYGDYDGSYSRSYLKYVKTGDVFRLRDKYESTEKLSYSDKLRANSLPNLEDTLSRVTPNNRTIVRAQENGDVSSVRQKYEVPRKSRSPTRWVPIRDEYVPKSKIKSTLERLGEKSESLYDPATIERVSKRDSVEKSVLKRVHTGLVETKVGRIESNIHLKSGLSLLGHMYTSSPSLTELSNMGPLVPPRPLSPTSAAPKKPLRLHQAVTAKPLQTSTPTVSPLDGSSLKSDLRVVTPPEMNRCFAGKNFPDYNAENHRPKSRYIPLDCQGAVSWTRSLERPRRLARAIAPASFNGPAVTTCAVNSCATSYFSCTRQMTVPSSRLSYSSSYSTNPSRSSIGSQGFILPYFDHRQAQPSSLPYVSPPSRVSSYSFQGDLPEPGNYYQYRPQTSRYDCRSLSPPRSYSQFSDVHSPARYGPYSGQRLPQDYSHNRNSYLSSGERSSYLEAKSLPGSVISTPRPISPPRSLYSARAPPRPPQRKSAREFEAQLTRSRNRLQAVRDHNFNKAVTWKDPVIGPLPFPYLAAGGYGFSRSDSPYKYDTSEVNIHYKTPVRLEQKEHIPDEELARRQEEHMQRVYEQERRKKYLAEVEDIERRRHADNFTPLQKSPIPLNRYDDDIVTGRPPNKQVARALFSFTAQNKRELSFNKGDVISVRRQIDKNWHEGELRGIVGIFPSNYVEILPAESLKSHVRKPAEGQARARFAFQAQTAMEMSLSKGETVILTRRVDQNWYEGRVGARRGIFPVSYVDVLVEPGDKASPSSSPLPRPALPSTTVLYNGVVPASASANSTMSGTSAVQQQQTTTVESRATYNQQLSVNTQQESVPYRALYNYKPQNEDELELKEGDVVMVMEKCDDGWYVGTSRRTSLFGTFPGNYVERIA
ncbi:uncharacterized protein LOC108676805 isoform X2 [Hyalella azteca]|uniref:Uncharacterized protein LOC108676805 isoform X2 n=1 Tax=Hyalella azteca TaxID=294128 RepID=A0A979FS71_HYAAZ|nr:uncharacterized protein LOC108676805 isoform X2 [Hyalella azteca]